MQMQYNVLHFTRSKPSAQTLADAKKFHVWRMDIAMVNVNWPNGTHSQYICEPRQDGTYTMSDTMKMFLTEDDLKIIEKEAKAVAEICKKYPELAQHVSK